MQVIAVLNQKGGSGKTTLATHIARGFQLGDDSHDPQEVVLVDSDPQGSARDWASARTGGGVLTVGLDRARALQSDVRRLRADVAVIDGAPSAADAAAAAVSVADLVLIPVQPSPYDIWAAEAIVDLVRQRQALSGNGTPRAAFVVNRKVEGSVLGDDVSAAIASYDLPVLSTQVHQRQSYPRTAVSGLTVLDQRSDRVAAAEIRALVDELRGYLSETVDA